MTSQYDEAGIRFQYPDSWKVSVDEANQPGVQALSVHSPEGAFWSLHLLRGERQSLVEQAISALKAEYQEVEDEPMEREIAGQRLSGYELHFFCLDFLVKSQVLAWQQAGAAVLVICQAESRQFEALQAYLTR